LLAGSLHDLDVEGTMQTCLTLWLIATIMLGLWILNGGSICAVDDKTFVSKKQRELEAMAGFGQVSMALAVFQVVYWPVLCSIGI